MSTPSPNIGLQRTSSRRLAAAEAGSFGVVAAFVLCALLWAGQMNAADLGIAYVAAQDVADGELPGVCISVKPAAGGLVSRQRLNQHGSIRFTLPPGEYHIKAFLTGFAAAEGNMRVTKGKVAVALLSLKVAPIGGDPVCDDRPILSDGSLGPTNNPCISPGEECK